MKSLIKIFITIVLFFSTTFLIIKLSGALSLETIELWLTQAKALAPQYAGITVAALLFADLFIAVPTLAVTLLSGYFLGFIYGATAALTGIVLAGSCGYALSFHYGTAVFNFLVKKEAERNEAICAFQQHGFVIIILSRAMPMLPEASACLSGMTRMPFKKFITAWLISSVPYTAIAAYGGSISSLSNPKPAIFTAIGVSAFFWIAWFFYRRMVKKT